MSSLNRTENRCAKEWGTQDVESPGGLTFSAFLPSVHVALLFAMAYQLCCNSKSATTLPPLSLTPIPIYSLLYAH